MLIDIETRKISTDTTLMLGRPHDTIVRERGFHNQKESTTACTIKKPLRMEVVFDIDMLSLSLGL